VTSIAGITEGRIVSLGGAPGGASADANGNIWVTLPGQGAVERVAAGSGQAQTFHTGGTPSAIAAGSDRIWVAGSSLGALASLNIFTGQPLSYTQFKRAPTSIRIDDDDSSLCTGDSNGALTHLDSTGAMLGSTGVAPSPTDVGCGEGWVWAVNDGPLGLVRMGDYGGARQFAVGAAPVAITFNGGVWLAHRDGTVNVFDPRPTQLKVTRQIAVAPSLDRIFAVENDTSVWAISKQTRTLYRISNTAQPSLTGTVVFNSPPVALTRVRQSIWVATQDGKLTEIRY
jgi:streptogramin lyase